MSSYPIDTIQSLVGDDWYEQDASNQLSRGSLVFAQVQFFSQIPFQLIPRRDDPQGHGTIIMEAKPLVSARAKGVSETLPVAALPRLDGADCYLVNRSKRRPCLVLGTVHDLSIPASLVKGMSNHSTAPFVPVAPFYSADQQGRAGYNSEFVERIKHAAYPSFFWDHLPFSGGKESILRLDQIQPMGIHHQAYSLTGHRLGDKALVILDQWLHWLVHGVPAGELAVFRELMAEFDE